MAATDALTAAELAHQAQTIAADVQWVCDRPGPPTRTAVGSLATAVTLLAAAVAKLAGGEKP